jgi:hypothetical protein
VQYSSKRLTRSSDILPALSALASHYHAKLNDKYLAGIWEGNALEDMLWFINSDEHTRSEGVETGRHPGAGRQGIKRFAFSRNIIILMISNLYERFLGQNVSGMLAAIYAYNVWYRLLFWYTRIHGECRHTSSIAAADIHC